MLGLADQTIEVNEATPMQDVAAVWPQIRSETRPWTRWWWHGAAVDRTTVTQLLEAYREAGIGGVEITSIYGVRGNEPRNLEYLSPAWLEIARHTVTEAKRLGMEVDLPPGSGWRIGGAFVREEHRAASLQIARADETNRYHATCVPSGEQVKRAGPGGGGPTFNPFSRAALQAVIDHFDAPFADLGIRAQFHDSWEYDTDCCPDFFEQFQERRGYDVRDELAALSGDADDDRVARVRYDYRLTLAELALSEFIVPWAEWCRDRGQLSRNQAHGSPGNLLDLYGAVDIPETEVFRSVRPVTPLVSKFASSAAHVAGRRLVSSETGTWLHEHFHVSLGDLKRLLDNLFVSGINHNLFHGTAYSPPEVEWPGWLFYASAQINPQNPIWRDLPALNAYITRCQAILQNGTPNNDLLVYFPVHDVWQKPGGRLAEKLHIRGDWLESIPAYESLQLLWDRGYAFDYVSDRQTERLSLGPDGKLVMPSESARGMDAERYQCPPAQYAAVVVPPCTYMPAATAEHLARLKEQGGHVLFVEPAPRDVPGLSDPEPRRARLSSAIDEATVVSDVEEQLAGWGVPREAIADVAGLRFIVRRHANGRDTFIVNEGEDNIDTWITLTTPTSDVLVMDPMAGASGLAERRESDGRVRVQLDPGQSWVLRTLDRAPADTRPWQYRPSDPQWRALQGEWRVEFVNGGPVLPEAYTGTELTSWTDRGGEYERFAGTARYRMVFDAPEGAGDYWLDLGTVHASAQVNINGRDVGVLVGPTFRTRLEGVEAKRNALEVEVTNLAANRIRDLDQRGVEWRIFEDINMASRDYGELDASGWDVLPSGLLGPVRLLAL